MKQFIIMIYLLTLTSFSLSKEIIRVGYFNTSLPILSDKSGVLMGNAVDYYESIGQEMNVEIQWVGPASVPRLLKMIKKGDIDMISFLSKSPKREKIVLYPNQPFMTIETSAIVSKDSPLSHHIYSWNDLKKFNKVGLRYGVRITKELQVKYPYINFSIIKDKDNKIFSSMILTLLQEHKLDMFIAPDPRQYTYQMKKQGIEDLFRIVKSPRPPKKNYVIFSQKREDLLHRYNTIYNKVTYKPVEFKERSK